MHRRVRTVLRSAALLSAATLVGMFAAGGALAQAWPAKPVTIVVTVPAGGSIDAVARAIANELSPALGQPVVVSNRGGAGGNIAADAVARSAPDGYTLLMGSSSTLTINPYIYRSMPFDPEKAFAPIAMPARINMILVTHPKSDASTLPQLVARIKANPGRLSYASSGTGALSHLAGELLATQLGAGLVHVPYKGIAPAANDLLAGQVDFMFDSASLVGQIKAGKVQALAVIGPNRLPILPNVATFRELGMPAIEAAGGFYVIAAPAGTPPAIVQRLNAEIVRIGKLPAVNDRIVAIGLEPASATPEALAAALRDEYRRLGPIVQAAQIPKE